MVILAPIGLLVLSQFDLGNYYTEEQVQRLSAELKQERLSWLAKFHSLNQDIINAIIP